MFVRSVGLFCFLVAIVANSSSPSIAADPPTEILQTPKWQTRIEAALDAKGDWDFFDAPLQSVCAELQDKLGIDVELDVLALEDYGIDPDAPITLRLNGISNRSFLRHMLRDLDLTYTVERGALMITNFDNAEARLITKVYPVGDLLLREEASRETADADYDHLIEMIESCVSPDTWDNVGGPGALEGIYDSLVVSQTQDVHEQIVELLETYRKIIAVDRNSNTTAKTSYWLGERAVNAAIYASLEEPITIEFKEVPLQRVAETLADNLNIFIVIDTRSLDDFGIDTSMPITGKFTKTPLKFVLQRLLYKHELTYFVRDEVLTISTPEECEQQLTIGLYPVRDLVLAGTEVITTADGATSYDFDSLIQVIHSTVSPDTWASVGGPSEIQPLLTMPTLVIPQTQDVHHEIAQLLTKLRRAKELADANRDKLDPNSYFLRAYPLRLDDCTADDIAKLVLRSTGMEAWSGQDETFVQGLGSSLVVKHNLGVHRAVQGLLKEVGVRVVLSNGCFACGVGGGGGAGSTGGGTVSGTSGGGGGMPASNGPSPGGFF